ncbi:MAG TPA: hypothetical protein VLF18_01500 [Tahibacter sp.]|uniref:hypothetical protein n=1 Tax=Tahibacter sp. TaxID=2056211 RepID=UPI002CC139D2|nr:hypothetical protein [Tahibacter sp.]HSX58850.1 hypothetical protein [Tahibacter sp.]
MSFRTAALIAALAAGTAQADVVTLQRTAPWVDETRIASNIRAECDLPNKLPAYIAEYAEEKRIRTRFSDAVAPGDAGRVLIVEIDEAVSRGNAFIGHQKFTRAKGALYENGAEIGNFVAQRYSMGGAFAGYKGSCSVLGRTVKAIGKDVAEWMAAPTKDARLGDQ